MHYLSDFLKSIYITKFSFYVLIGLIVASFSITFYLLLPNNLLVKDPQNLLILLSLDVIFVIILMSLLIRQILLVFIYRRKNIDESRLYIKFVNLFTAMALGPAIGVVIITALFFNLELRTWYGGAVKEAVVNSNIVARDYENEIQSEIVSSPAEKTILTKIEALGLHLPPQNMNSNLVFSRTFLGTILSIILLISLELIVLFSDVMCMPVPFFTVILVCTYVSIPSVDPFPIAIAKLLAFFFERFSKPLITKDQLTLLKYDNVLSKKNKSNNDIGFEAKLRFEDEIEKYTN